MKKVVYLGSGLIEVLCSLMILSIVVLGSGLVALDSERFHRQSFNATHSLLCVPDA